MSPGFILNYPNTVNQWSEFRDIGVPVNAGGLVTSRKIDDQPAL